MAALSAAGLAAAAGVATCAGLAAGVAGFAAGLSAPMAEPVSTAVIAAAVRVLRRNFVMCTPGVLWDTGHAACATPRYCAWDLQWGRVLCGSAAPKANRRGFDSLAPQR